MCAEAVHSASFSRELCHVPDHFKTEKILKNAVSDDPYPSIFVLNCYLRQLEIWHRDADNDKEAITWYNAYK